MYCEKVVSIRGVYHHWGTCYRLMPDDCGGAYPIIRQVIEVAVNWHTIVLDEETFRGDGNWGDTDYTFWNF